MEGIPFQEVGNLMFTVCSPEEVKKLSVMEITNPLAFDMLEHPVSDGLYDPHLGPNNHDELCETCSLKLMHCPGHNGHIALPLPVFHPVFIKTLYQLLQGTCFKCHQMVAPKNATQVAFYQFQALDYGLVGTVKQMAEAVSDPSIISTDKTVETSFFLQEKLKSILEKAVDGAEMKNLQSQVKSVVECRQRIVKEFLRTNFTNARKKCPHCGAKKPIISLRHNSQFISHVEKRDATRRLAKTVVKAEDRGIESIDMSENLLPDDDDDDEESSGNISITPADAKKHLNIVWEKEKMFLQRIFGILRTKGHICEQPINIFFVELLIVPPSRFRPISVVKGRKYLNPKSAALKNVLTTSLLMKNLIKFRNGDDLPDADKDQLLKLPGKNDQDKFANLWQQLQLHVNCVYDSEANKLDKDKTFAGVKQILEKKEGLFRKNMMGKRVNFAARSVISPDPNIMVDEVGVPVVFAKKLTYPTPVADWNFEKLRRAVINGPNVHPGADKVEMGDGRIIKLSATDPLQRQALACQLLTPLSSAKGVYKGIPKKVHRHLVNGDMLLLNRQPTLHKPSIMAHKARVLPGEKTLRLHYANCKSYNADFDGDEMNAHFPQDDVSRSEGINIAGVNHQYLVPKDGTPLSGLIQDHIIAGTLLTVRGSFFNKVEYQQLVYGAIAFKGKTVTYLPPTMLKPQQLWSGKQVVSTIIINIIPEGKPPPTIEGKTKVDEKSWQNELARLWTAGGPLHDDMCESEVIIRSGELLCGIIDKAHIGPTPYSLVHCCYELYGGETSSALLTALARLFTLFLQMQKGFTLSYEDILLTDEASKNRHETIRNARKVGDKVVAKAFDVDDPNNKSQIIGKFREAHLARDDIGLKTLDFEMKNATNSFNDEINKFCNRWGLLKKFPSNNLQLMVLSGAKGGLVNSTQISGALGQIELEGRRVPLMQTGKTLPSFLSYDTSPRAGGFVDECFLSGVHIQEYFFHCMAGREGLIDTAVKTSRSGYLQRCLIKHLEGLVVNYDMTVRDSDGSVIQFLYGEDGLDVSKMQMLKEGKLHLLAENYASVVDEDQIEILKADTEHSLMPDPLTSKNDLHENLGIQNSQLSHSELSNMSTLYQHKVYSFLHSKKNRSCPDFQETSLTPARSDPLNSKFRADLTFGTVSEKLDNLIQDYVFNNYLNVQGKKKRKKRAAATRALDMYYYRAMKALVQPGEAVGLLAAQSIGEPSTQMTLNTFHFAGRGEMNVTLGIPRLREILMIASASIATPTMDLPLLKLPNVEKKADKLRIKLSSVSLNQVMQGINISEIKHVKSKYHRFRKYVVRMTFCPHSVYKKKLHTSPSEILQYIENTFIHKIITVIKKKLTILSKANSLTTSRKDKGPTISNSETDDFQPTVVDLDEGETSDEGANDDDTAASKARNRHNQELEYEEPESDENPDDPDSDEPMNDESSILKTEFDSGLETNDNEDMEDILKILKNEMHKNNSSSKVQQTGYKQKKARIESIKQKYQWVQDYDYDYEEQLWCQFTLQLCLEGSKVDIKTLLEDEAASAILYSVSGIKQAFLIKNPDSKVGGQMLKTDGVNFLEIFKHVNIIDTSKVYSNDIHAIAKIYGIEAAARVLVKEIKNVFATYHITVDPRHLLLIADYMTYDGTFKACNRIGMESNASPIQQMTFETTMNFLQTAALSGSEDLLKSPSARLVVGQSVRVGTGSFDLLIKPDDVMQEKLN